MLRKFFVLAGLLLASVSAPAAVIEYKGYSRDSSSNIVTGGGLEWLMWDVTKGKSIEQALKENSGWSLANTSQMVQLFNVFEFGKTDWDPKYLHVQLVDESWNAGENYSQNNFHELFGLIQGPKYICNDSSSTWCFLDTDPSVWSGAIYADHDARRKLALVIDDATFVYDDGSKGTQGSFAALGLYEDQPEVFDSMVVGIALVRTAQTIPTPVSLPSSVSIFALGLAGLAYRRRKGAIANLCGQAA
ncbi:hypothetical protein A5320_03490 [Rheinheimera sp. SA_1]|uniref:PEP-CTERM sorting domain-containing protein n=1 Tax=Rheinheimera sp. SA_1 TaxID=1827365 RepID=UPI0007FF7166|nr:PEP-CTERM sorting domain-containing protein [Rheinheimera sp. SA_1]OBP16482.1 hypothetical protein A5320_03490 [Rheinheimera sp. SA_1]